jgi:hypothetical protein
MDDLARLAQDNGRPFCTSATTPTAPTSSRLTGGPEVLALGDDQRDVVMHLGPVVADEYLPHSHLPQVVSMSPRRPASNSWFSARDTSSHQPSEVVLTDPQAHDLGVGLCARSSAVLTCRRLGYQHHPPR